MGSLSECPERGVNLPGGSFNLMKHLLYFFSGLAALVAMILWAVFILWLLYLAARHFLITIFIGVAIYAAHLIYQLGKAFY